MACHKGPSPPASTLALLPSGHSTTAGQIFSEHKPNHPLLRFSFLSHVKSKLLAIVTGLPGPGPPLSSVPPPTSLLLCPFQNTGLPAFPQSRQERSCFRNFILAVLSTWNALPLGLDLLSSFTVPRPWCPLPREAFPDHSILNSACVLQHSPPQYPSLFFFVALTTT